MENQKPAAPIKSTNVRAIIGLLTTKVALQLGFALAPAWASERAARLFLQPWRRPSPERPAPLSHATPFVAESPYGAVAAWSFGRAGDPVVLLVHGWEDDHLSWAPLIDSLVGRSYRVLTLDLPGHGRTPRTPLVPHLTTIPILAAGIAALGREAEAIDAAPIQATIAHSLGGTATVIATAELGLRAGRLALLAPPNHPRLFAAAMMKMLGLSKPQVVQVFSAIERLVGRSMDSLYLPPKLRSLALPGLILHSRDDRLVPLQHSQENADAWSGAQFHTLDGLGHRRLMTDPAVHRMLLRFVSGEMPVHAKADAAD